jgi:hypothetical protein
MDPTKIMKFPALLTALFLAPVLVAQDDTVHLASGDVVAKVKVEDWSIRELTYRKDGTTQKASTDQVAKIELEKFAEVYRRGIAGSDPDYFLATAREQQKEKKDLMSQLGYVEAARLFFQQGKEANAGAALQEMADAFPQGGLLPELYRMKFETYMGRGDDAGYRNAGLVAEKFRSEAVTNAWPQGLALEAEFFKALAEGATGGDAAAFQTKMRQIVGSAGGVNPRLAGRANVQLADSMRRTGDADGAERLYTSILDRASSDENSRAGAYLGLGLIAMGKAGDSSDADLYKKALLLFLRVHLETGEAWDSLQAEALYNGMDAAQKWRGEDYRVIASRCRYILVNDFGHTAWAERARAR